MNVPSAVELLTVCLLLLLPDHAASSKREQGPLPAKFGRRLLQQPGIALKSVKNQQPFSAAERLEAEEWGYVYDDSGNTESSIKSSSLSLPAGETPGLILQRRLERLRSMSMRMRPDRYQHWLARLRQWVFCVDSHPTSLEDLKEYVSRANFTLFIYDTSDAISDHLTGFGNWEVHVAWQMVWAMGLTLPPPPTSTSQPGPSQGSQAQRAQPKPDTLAQQQRTRPRQGQQSQAHAQLPQAPQAPAPRAPPLFVDVGAHIGWHSFTLAARGYEVLAFEAMKESVQAMRNTMCDNPKLMRAVTVYPYALATNDSRCWLYSHYRSNGDAFVRCGPRSEPEAEALASGEYKSRGPVRQQRLDQLVRRDVQVLKVDVRGYEPLVLGGARRLLLEHRVWFMVLEWNTNLMRRRVGPKAPDKLLHALASLGYRLSTTSLAGPFLPPGPNTPGNSTTAGATTTSRGSLRAAPGTGAGPAAAAAAGPRSAAGPAGRPARGQQQRVEPRDQAGLLLPHVRVKLFCTHPAVQLPEVNPFLNRAGKRSANAPADLSLKDEDEDEDLGIRRRPAGTGQSGNNGRIGSDMLPMDPEVEGADINLNQLDLDMPANPFAMQVEGTDALPLRQSPAKTSASSPPLVELDYSDSVTTFEEDYAPKAAPESHGGGGLVTHFPFDRRRRYGRGNSIEEEEEEEEIGGLAGSGSKEDAEYYEASGLNEDGDEELGLVDPPLTDPGDEVFVKALAARKKKRRLEDPLRDQLLGLGLDERLGELAQGQRQ